jgi:ABC-type multidrug transport system fused ATPase/permease subunit
LSKVIVIRFYSAHKLLAFNSIDRNSKKWGAGEPPMIDRSDKPKPWTIVEVLKPHSRTLTFGLLAVIGESVASLLDPWPLKIVLDNVLKSRPIEGWLKPLIASVAGTDNLAVVKFAAIAVIAIAALGAVCSYAEKYFTTSVGQWVMHDLRRTVYSHIQRMSLGFHDKSQTGDLISRLQATSTPFKVLSPRDCWAL